MPKTGVVSFFGLTMYIHSVLWVLKCVLLQTVYKFMWYLSFKKLAELYQRIVKCMKSW